MTAAVRQLGACSGLVLDLEQGLVPVDGPIEALANDQHRDSRYAEVWGQAWGGP